MCRCFYFNIGYIVMQHRTEVLRHQDVAVKKVFLCGGINLTYIVQID